MVDSSIGPENRGYLGQATVSLVEPAGLDQAAQESQQAMPELHGIAEVSQRLDAALRGADRLCVASSVGQEIGQDAKSPPAFGEGQRCAFFDPLSQEPAAVAG